MTRLKLDAFAYTYYPVYSIGAQLNEERFGAISNEGNAYLGWSLVAITVFIVVWLRRSPAVRALAVVGLAAVVLSFGTPISVLGMSTGNPGPLSVLSHLPLISDIVAVRFGVGCRASCRAPPGHRHRQGDDCCRGPTVLVRSSRAGARAATVLDRASSGRSDPTRASASAEYPSPRAAPILR
jgi:hypothetical protein